MVSLRDRCRVCAPAIGALGLCSGAGADWVGGLIVSHQAWNQQATAALGQQASVFRLYLAFDDPADFQFATYKVELQTNDGSLLYQDPLGGNLPPTKEIIAFSPSVRWDSYVSAGNITAPSGTFVDPSFYWSPNGLTTNPAFESDDGGGWYSVPYASGSTPRNEVKVYSPGALDEHGDKLIPDFLDPQYLYGFRGQFTVLGVDYLTNTQVGLGIVHSDFFSGILGLAWLNSADFTPQEFDHRRTFIGVGYPTPSPGGAALLALAGLVCAGRGRAAE